MILFFSQAMLGTSASNNLTTLRVLIVLAVYDASIQEGFIFLHTVK